MLSTHSFWHLTHLLLISIIWSTFNSFDPMTESWAMYVRDRKVCVDNTVLNLMHYRKTMKYVHLKRFFNVFGIWEDIPHIIIQLEGHLNFFFFLHLYNDMWCIYCSICPECTKKSLVHMKLELHGEWSIFFLREYGYIHVYNEAALLCLPDTSFSKFGLAK